MPVVVKLCREAEIGHTGTCPLMNWPLTNYSPLSPLDLTSATIPTQPVSVAVVDVINIQQHKVNKMHFSCHVKLLILQKMQDFMKSLKVILEDCSISKCLSGSVSPVNN